MPPLFNHGQFNPCNSTISHATHSIIHWLSITPGFPSFGFHLCDKHRSLFACNLLVLTSSPPEAAVCQALLPDSLAVATPFTDVIQQLGCATSGSCHPNPNPTDLPATVFLKNCPQLHGADATCHSCNRKPKSPGYGPSWTPSTISLPNLARSA
jgi:hypothetical protein